MPHRMKKVQEKKILKSKRTIAQHKKSKKSRFLSGARIQPKPISPTTSVVD